MTTSATAMLGRAPWTSAGDLDQSGFDAALDELGRPRVQEVIWLVGLYRSLATAMRVARIPAPRTISKG